jgi:hypothetical protein
VSVSGLTLVRERAEAKGRFLWFWMPERLQNDREAIRRAVASRLHARAKGMPAKQYENLDKVFSGGGRHGNEDEE